MHNTTLYWCIALLLFNRSCRISSQLIANFIFGSPRMTSQQGISSPAHHSPTTCSRHPGDHDEHVINEYAADRWGFTRAPGSSLQSLNMMCCIPRLGSVWSVCPISLFVCAGGGQSEGLSFVLTALSYVGSVKPLIGCSDGRFGRCLHENTHRRRTGCEKYESGTRHFKVW